MRLFTLSLWLLCLLLGTDGFYHYVRKPDANTPGPNGIEDGRPGHPQIKRRHAKPATPRNVLKYALKYETVHQDQRRLSRREAAATPHAANFKRSIMLVSSAR